MKGPDLARLLAGPVPGHQLAEIIRAAHGGGGKHNGNGSAPATPADFMGGKAPSKPWDDIPGTLKGGRNDGVMRLACGLRETTSLSLDEAIDHMHKTVYPLIDQGQGGHGFSEEEFEEVIAAVWRQYPGAAEKAERARQAADDLAAHPLPSNVLELTDAYLANRVAGELFRVNFCWVPGMGWMAWNGQVWMAVDQASVWNIVRQYFIWMFEKTAEARADAAMLGKLSTLLSRARIAALTDLVRGHSAVLRQAEDFDSHPDLINTPDGIVDLKTGNVADHDPGLMLTKITSGSYRRGYTHPDWEQALTALPDPERLWFQRRIGQAITGYPTPDGIMPVLQGSGENGKSCLTTDGPVKALGDYADMASHKLITSQRANATEHSTEMADLRGQRLLIGEELSEGRSIDVTALKRIMDVGRIKARYVHRDNISFDASHSLFVTTNYRPQITETDHGTWRRLALVEFPYSYRKAGQELLTDTDRHGDPGLKHRIRYNWNGQHDAIVTWAVDGAIAWYAAGQVAAPVTEKIDGDTREWRKTADLILSFWDEFLEPAQAAGDEHPPCIAASHMLAVFIAWLQRNGHQPWSKETFGMRFKGHEETTAHGVRSVVTKKLGNLSVYRGSDLYVQVDPPAKQQTVWQGVRFRKAPDQAIPFQGEEGEEVKQTLPSECFTGEFIETSSPSSPPPPGTVFFDLETGSASDLFTYTQSDETGYVRLAGWTVGEGDPRIGSAAELLPELEDAAEICGHNILGFDLLALAHHHGADWEKLAAKARDTEIIERQANPPRSRESGTSADAYDLDHVAGRLGLPGKTDSIATLKRKHGGYDKIPLDDPDYRGYLEGDVRATAAVAGLRHHDAYTRREHRVAALAGRMTLNGFLVDRELLEERRAAGQARKREALGFLHDAWGLPLGRTVLRGRGAGRHEVTEEIASPLATDAGRDWLAGMYERYQIPEPPRTGKTGKLSTGAEDLKTVAADPACPADLKSAIALIGIVVGTRTVYQTAADCLAPDGRVHPMVSMRQASGRWSVTNPGLTVFGKRGGRHVERDIFLPDPGHVLVSFDLSQVDMRSMAWLSRDHGYRALFAPGRDAHAEIAAQIGITRDAAKAIGHGWNYGLSAARMIREGRDPDLVNAFVAGMQERFPVLIAWREQIREQGKAGLILDNGFGRRMRCDPDRAYTVAPALMGQGGARDIMCESLLRLPAEIHPMLRVMVHDEIVCSVPKTEVLEVAGQVMAAMTWQLDDDLPVLCDMSAGNTWGEASAK